jgi:hypothetical protein
LHKKYFHANLCEDLHKKYFHANLCEDLHAHTSFENAQA